MWTRVSGVQGLPLDLLTARIGRRHYAPHTHDEYAIGVCTDGVQSIRYRGERHRAGPGGVVVLEPGEPHTGGTADAHGFSYRAFYPAGELLRGVTPSSGDRARTSATRSSRTPCSRHGSGRRTARSADRAWKPWRANRRCCPCWAPSSSGMPGGRRWRSRWG
ncbi:AraC family ligand binding domain-containing protein [Actinomadura viridis]|uniref:AraC family ligand binding domain-containing protein n=1 Tax=Actinomadura viridis TaxID=58110 RepID=UPI0036D0EB88